MGGSRSEEFLARSAVGEDTFVQCTTCDYAANVEAVAVPSPAAVAYDGVPAAHAEQTPDTPTIESLVAHLRSEEQTSELQSLMRSSYAVFCLKKKKIKQQ